MSKQTRMEKSTYFAIFEDHFVLSNCTADFPYGNRACVLKGMKLFFSRSYFSQCFQQNFLLSANPASQILSLLDRIIRSTEFSGGNLTIIPIQLIPRSSYLLD